MNIYLRGQSGVKKTEKFFNALLDKDFLGGKVRNSKKSMYMSPVAEKRFTIYYLYNSVKMVLRKFQQILKLANW